MALHGMEKSTCEMPSGGKVNDSATNHKGSFFGAAWLCSIGFHLALFFGLQSLKKKYPDGDRLNCMPWTANMVINQSENITKKSKKECNSFDSRHSLILFVKFLNLEGTEIFLCVAPQAQLRKGFLNSGS